MSYGYRYPTESGGLSLASIITFLHPYWAGLKRYWWIPAILAGLASAGMVLVIRNQPPPSYVSSARIWVEVRNADLSARGGQQNNTPDATQLEIINSPALRDRAHNETQARFPALRVTPVQLSVSQLPDAAIYRMQAYSLDAAYTKAFLEVFIDEYEKYLRDMATRQTTETVELIRREAEQVRRELDEAQKKLADFTEEHTIDMLTQRNVSSEATYGKLLAQQLDYQLELDKLKLLTAEQVMQDDVKLFRSVASASNVQLPTGADAARMTDDPEIMARLNTSNSDSPLARIYSSRLRLGMFQHELTELGLTLKPKHPRIVALKESITRTEKELAELVKQNQEKIEERKASIEKLLMTLEPQIIKYREEALKWGKKMAEFNRLQNDVKLLQPKYDRLNSGADMYAMRDAMTTFRISKLDPPSPARANTANNIVKIVVAVGVGLVLGVGVVALIVFFDDRVKSLSALKASFQEPVIGQVPNIGQSEANDPVDLIKENDDRHNFTESYRNIRSSILFMDAGETRPKTIVITSAIPSEGKSSVAANLAKTMAMSGSKVLLVDGDQRRCSINEKMGLPVGPGFSDVLTGKMAFDKVVLNPEPNLYVLVRGTSIKNPGELFVGTAADDFLRSVYDRFDYILIDTPPVLAADDVTSLAPKVDGVVFVIRAEHTSARLAKQSLELLYNRHVRVLGLIYNRANLFLPEYSYYKYSSYYNRPDEKKEETSS